MILEPTSERVIEDTYKRSDAAYVVYVFHLATYAYAAKLATGLRILDLGCGSGYGTAMLAREAASATGVDVAQDAITHATSRYACANLRFLPIEPGRPLPFPSASFDLVTSFQVIEHVDDVPAYLREIKRVLTPSGRFIVVTPDRSARLFPFQKPWNAWHLKEYDARGLRLALEREFNNVSIEKMGAPSPFVDIEIDRYRRMRLLSLPLTLPVVPEHLRQPMLRALSRRRLRAITEKSALSKKIAAFSVNDVTIGPDVHPSVNVIGLARP